MDTKRKGITLIALVITIIVLLILAGISINMLSGDNSILKQATEARDKTGKNSLKEEAQIALMGRKTNGYAGENNKTLKQELENVISGSEVEEIEGISDVCYVKKENEYITVYENGEIEEGKVEIWDGETIKCPEMKKENNIWNWYISKPSELKFLADFVNNGDGNTLPEELNSYVTSEGYNTEDVTMTADTTIYLMNNLDLGARQKDGIKTEGADWIPIGINSNNVENKLGSFEGNNHYIKGVYVNRETSYNGLFGISNKIQNLTIKDSYIQGKTSTGGIAGGLISGKLIYNCYNINTIVKANKYGGGIVGNSKGSVNKCENTGDISFIDNVGEFGSIGGIAGRMSKNGESIEIKNCINNGKVDGKGVSIGGIAGYTLNTIVMNCTNNGNITHSMSGTGYQQDVGGIIGGLMSSSEVRQCINNGNINSDGHYTAGIVGRLLNCTSIEKCFNNGKISSNKYYSGGILGATVINQEINCTIKNCYNTAEISGNIYVGGVIGITAESAGNIQNCYNIGLIKGNNSIGGLIGDNQNSSSVVNCYYLTGTAGKDFGNASSSNCAKDKNFITTDFVSTANQDGVIWKVVEGENNGYPVLIKTKE